MSSDSIYKQERLTYLRSLGLCTLCGKEDALPGKSRCASCKVSGNTQYRRRYHERKAKGLCVQCGESNPRKGKVLCGRCRRRQTIRSRKVVHRRVAEARCMRCGGDIEFDREKSKYCLKCFKKHQTRNAKYSSERIENNLCSRCGCDLPEGVKHRQCDPCREFARNWAKRSTDTLKEKHKCVRCKAKLSTADIGNGNTSCETCRYNTTLSRHRRKLKAQMVKQADTGDLKSPAHLEHAGSNPALGTL